MSARPSTRLATRRSARADVDAAPGTVVAIVRPGYGRSETVLRPAGVIVSRGHGLTSGGRGLLRGPRRGAGRQPPTRSSGPTASWPGPTTLMSTRTRARRNASRRSPRPTTSCPTPRPRRRYDAFGPDFRQVPDGCRSGDLGGGRRRCPGRRRDRQGAARRDLDDGVLGSTSTSTICWAACSAAAARRRLGTGRRRRPGGGARAVGRGGLPGRPPLRSPCPGPTGRGRWR